ncbi:NAD(P)H-dependent glycerol-3-phosphate dehydrogenase [Candidatus Dependentiae bacterium]|nr:NAD(P)H-dependent glycerol-3-phosphate dehydrogenase [Candidatus Dependentiae bacterium]
MTLRATVLGGGAWGCAIASLLANRGYDVVLWCREQEIADEINNHHTNSVYLAGLKLPASVKATTDLREAAQHADLVFEAIPVAFLRSVLQAFKHYHNNHRWVILSKGIEQHSFALPSQILEDILKPKAIGVLVGPTFARDLVEKQFSAAVFASLDEAFVNELRATLPTYYFALFPSRDVIGVQVAGAIKNVLALAVGIAKGAGCKDNTIAYLLTLGMEEMAQVLSFFCGDRLTMYGLAGLGDMLLTCTGGLSKNQRAGYLLGQGKTLHDVLAELKTLPEGINTAQSLAVLMEREKLFFPILAATQRFIAHDHSLETFFASVLRGPVA